MKISTKTILVLGVIQTIILTLILILFFRYQTMLEEKNSAQESIKLIETESR